MNHWTDDDRDEFEEAITAAQTASNDRDRTVDFIRIVKKYETAHDVLNEQRKASGSSVEPNWAFEVLDGALRDGMWVRLKKEIQKQKTLKIHFAGRNHTVSAIGGAIRKTVTHFEFEQLAFEDMDREQLLRKLEECDAHAFAARRNKQKVQLHITLIDLVPGSVTAREAATALGTTVDTWILEQTA